MTSNAVVMMAAIQVQRHRASEHTEDALRARLHPKRQEIAATCWIDNGGEGGIRTLSAPLESVTYRFYGADVAAGADLAVAPCTTLHHTPNCCPWLAALDDFRNWLRLGLQARERNENRRDWAEWRRWERRDRD